MICYLYFSSCRLKWTTFTCFFSYRFEANLKAKHWIVSAEYHEAEYNTHLDWSVTLSPGRAKKIKVLIWVDHKSHSVRTTSISASVGGWPIPTHSVLIQRRLTNIHYHTCKAWSFSLLLHPWALKFNSIQTIKPQAFCDRGPVKDTDWVLVSATRLRIPAHTKARFLLFATRYWAGGSYNWFKLP